ncbi:chorismate mutase [Dimargaris cristalligena]|uniref:Chorismate mutase n=1 Tax=Dimargaris cristalligena TaxID=215637 RepID=A0A4V1J4Z2_9FUNG|nr:chorismate mutase [Dimargaris cristalligena]|eukprot:RKP37249.1 chorismate mutase [Dimargaris cristalligena]
MDLLKTQTQLSLSELRNTLIRLEDTIIFGLIERAQFKSNDIIYQQGAFHFDNGFTGSFLEYLIWELEKAHAKVRRYQSPDEYPFTPADHQPPLPAPILPALDYPPILHPNHININAQILTMYTASLIPQACAPGDDSNYGSSATKDVECLQNLSKRIHYGKFIAESKFQDPQYHDQYVQLIKARDAKGIYQLLTNEAVERKLLRRLRRKATIYGQDIDDDDATATATANAAGPSKISPDVVVDLYEKYVIPLTKQVEVDYLLQRLD